MTDAESDQIRVLRVELAEIRDDLRAAHALAFQKLRERDRLAVVLKEQIAHHQGVLNLLWSLLTPPGTETGESVYAVAEQVMAENRRLREALERIASGDVESGPGTPFLPMRIAREALRPKGEPCS